MKLANYNFPGQPQWRSHEHAGAMAAFEDVYEVGGGGVLPNMAVLRWFPPSENCSRELYAQMARMRESVTAPFHINDVRNYKHVHDKLSCFEAWMHAGIPTPGWFEWQPGQFVPQFEPPYLLRLNNSVAGYDSWLVREPSQLPEALAAVEAAHARNTGAIPRLLCTKFINTQVVGKLNHSFRIIVAGGKVVTGYARVSDATDWVAVTNKFNREMAESWLHCNQLCQRIMTQHEETIVRAVEVLGLNHQGVDVISDAAGQLYFLEVQTTYDAGFIGCGHYKPPFYNPYNPELVEFIKNNAAEIERELPLYFFNWLEKAQHFRVCYQNLRRQSRL